MKNIFLSFVENVVNRKSNTTKNSSKQDKPNYPSKEEFEVILERSIREIGPVLRKLSSE